ncbi:MAG: hypothetical protein E7015_00495 [Alphaproteobacteria bacterium]|nr:hypothetical protein [Alphaproteobacteria bacterium]
MFLKFFYFCCILTTFFSSDGSKSIDSETDKICEFCKLASSDTLIILDATAFIVRFLDTAFAYDNEMPQKLLFDNFLKKRKKFPQDKNDQIDKALLNSYKRFAEDKLIHSISEAKKKKALILVVFDKTNKFICSDKILQMISKQLSHILGEPQDKWKDLGIKNCPYGILATSSQNISKDLIEILKYILQKHPIKQLMLITHDSRRQLFNLTPYKLRTLSISTDESTHKKISPELIKKQYSILEKHAQWYDDISIKKLSQTSSEQILYDGCKEMILDVCPCKQINEIHIFNRLIPLLEDSPEEKYILETIEDFQEIRSTLIPILYFAGNKGLSWVFKSTHIDPKKINQLSFGSSTQFKYDPTEAAKEPFKAIKQKGCGIHWKDMIKFQYCMQLIGASHADIEIFCPSSERQTRYKKTLEFIIKSMNLRNEIHQILQNLLKSLEKSDLDREQLFQIRKALAL